MSNKPEETQAQEIDATLLNEMTEDERQLLEALINGYLAQQQGDFSGYTDWELAALFGL